MLSRLRCAERITLSPEGNSVAAMLRFLRHRLATGQTVFSLSFHGSSLAPGRNPYVRNRRDLYQFYDRLAAVIDAMASELGFGFAALAEIPGLMRAAAEQSTLPPFIGDHSYERRNFDYHRQLDCVG